MINVMQCFRPLLGFQAGVISLIMVATMPIYAHQGILNSPIEEEGLREAFYYWQQIRGTSKAYQGVSRLKDVTNRITNDWLSAYWASLATAELGNQLKDMGYLDQAEKFLDRGSGSICCKQI